MIENQVYEIMKKDKIISLDSLSNKVGKSIDYILSGIEDDSRYSLKEGILSLNGLGLENCVLCGDKNTTSKISGNSSIKIVIPKEFLEGYKLIEELEEGIISHRECYSKIDVFFRIQDTLKCIDCIYFSGAWVDGDSVEEKCIKWDDEHVGHKGSIASMDMCNFFIPDTYLRKESLEKEYKEERKLLDEIEPQIRERTNKGYKELISILEKLSLIEKV